MPAATRPSPPENRKNRVSIAEAMAWLERSRRQPPQSADDAGQVWSWQRLWALPLILLTLLAPVSAVVAADPLAADLTRLQAGEQLFAAHCMGCHLNGGNVIRRGRTLKQAALERAGLTDPEAIARVAAAGIGQMSGYGAVLGEEGAAQVGEWVWLQAQAGWPRTPQMQPLP